MRECAAAAVTANNTQQQIFNTISPKAAECLREKFTGPCRARFIRFFYNSSSGRCDEFVYGGCQKNENNFETRQDCEAKCVVTTATTTSSSIQVEKQTANDDETTKNKCSMPADAGLCRGYFPKFFFNASSQKCEQFIYGGCGGNANNYETVDECTRECGPPTTVVGNDQAKCSAPAESGPCFAYFTKYFFNVTSQKCEQFVYGGCGGNANNYETFDECLSSCASGEIPERCVASSDPGNCFAYIPRFFYNTTSKTCEQFIYGGCGGNQNNFLTIEECSSTCSRTTRPVRLSAVTVTSSSRLPEKCSLRPDMGPCYASMPRYFYNSTTQSCEHFMYGGCGGNENRFVTSDECRRECAAASEQLASDIRAFGKS